VDEGVAFMDNTSLTKWEKKFLHALKRYPYANIGTQELHGYFHFPPIEITLSTVGTLEKKGFISKKNFPPYGYQLEEPGKQYLQQHRFVSSKLWPIVKKVVGYVVCAFVTVLVTRFFS